MKKRDNQKRPKKVIKPGKYKKMNKKLKTKKSSFSSLKRLPLEPAHDKKDNMLSNQHPSLRCVFVFYFVIILKLCICTILPCMYQIYVNLLILKTH